MYALAKAYTGKLTETNDSEHIPERLPMTGGGTGDRPINGHQLNPVLIPDSLATPKPGF